MFGESGFLLLEARGGLLILSFVADYAMTESRSSLSACVLRQAVSV